MDLCEAYFTEARWFSNGVVPNLEDYVSNGITSAGTYIGLVLAFFLMGKQVNKETSCLVNSKPKLFTSAGKIFRLWDDLGTAMVQILFYSFAKSEFANALLETIIFLVFLTKYMKIKF